jgi:hypothetical protein
VASPTSTADLGADLDDLDRQLGQVDHDATQAGNAIDNPQEEQ